MGNSTSNSNREEPKEEETDINFNETVEEAPDPPEPRADPDIEENIDGGSTFSEFKVTSVSSYVLWFRNSESQAYASLAYAFPSWVLAVLVQKLLRAF